MVGLSEIILPIKNLERAYNFDKELEAVLWRLQFKQYAGPQKTEVIKRYSTI